MDDTFDLPVDPEALQVDPLPDSISEGATVVVATAGDPSPYAIGLRALCRCGKDTDTGFLVTTTESANQTLKTYDRLCPENDRPRVGVVDSVSEQQSVSALYGETPTVFIPSPGDLERLAMALSDLSRKMSPSSGSRHLVVRSLTPILKAASTNRVCTVLDRLVGLRSETGLCLLGVDYTAHDEETMSEVAESADGVLWVTRTSSDRLKLDYQQTRRQYDPSIQGSDGDD